MELLGIGPLEILIIGILLLLVLGPQELEKLARDAGRALNRLYRSENYHLIRKMSAELRDLPQQLAEEARLEELKETLAQETDNEPASRRANIELTPPTGNTAVEQDLPPPK